MTSHIDDTADGQNWSEVHLETFNIWGLLSADPLCGLHFSFFLRFLSTYDLSTGSPRSEITKRYGIHVAKQKSINKNVISTLTWNYASKTIKCYRYIWHRTSRSYQRGFSDPIRSGFGTGNCPEDPKKSQKPATGSRTRPDPDSNFFLRVGGMGAKKCLQRWSLKQNVEHRSAKL
jgi:hypothetical protein